MSISIEVSAAVIEATLGASARLIRPVPQPKSMICISGCNGMA